VVVERFYHDWHMLLLADRCPRRPHGQERRCQHLLAWAAPGNCGI